MMDIVEQPQHRQQRKPIPKPRKFLLKNNALLLESSAGQSGAGTSLNGVPSPPTRAQQDPDALVLASSSSASTITHPPPPLPPRPSLAALPERPLPPVPGTAPITIHSHSLLTNFQQIDPKPNTPASSDQSCDQQKFRRQRLYPNLDELLLGTATSGPEDLLVMKCNGTGKGSPSSASSTSSNFPSSSSASSDDSPHQIFHSSSSVAAVAASSSAGPYTSFCEPFGADAQSDGESVCFSGWVQFAVNGTAKQRKRGWALIRNNHFCINQNDEVI